MSNFDAKTFVRAIHKKGSHVPIRMYRKRGLSEEFAASLPFTSLSHPTWLATTYAIEKIGRGFATRFHHFLGVHVQFNDKNKPYRDLYEY